MKNFLLVFSLAALPVLGQSTGAQSTGGQSPTAQSANAHTSGAPTMPNPLSAALRYGYNMSKNDVLKSAEEMPEENYSFKPVDTVRTFGQLVGHVADAQYEFCSAVVGDNKQPPGIEKSKTTKADLIQALKDAFAYCDQAYTGMTDAQASQLIGFFGHQAPKLSILWFNYGHNMEHYGNMVTYLRMKGLVPPSSQQQSMQ